QEKLIHPRRAAEQIVHGAAVLPPLRPLLEHQERPRTVRVDELLDALVRVELDRETRDVVEVAVMDRNLAEGRLEVEHHEVLNWLRHRLPPRPKPLRRRTTIRARGAYSAPGPRARVPGRPADTSRRRVRWRARRARECRAARAPCE